KDHHEGHEDKTAKTEKEFPDYRRNSARKPYDLLPVTVVEAFASIAPTRFRWSAIFLSCVQMCSVSHSNRKHMTCSD
ncbi:MAG: hypothetical protein NTW40_03055, partial [Acidobacteria bacterium]|nr:hypothetical protein [Acidobacteriota bacterium]